MQHETLGELLQLRTQFFQLEAIHASVGGCRPFVPEVGCPIDEQPLVRLLDQAQRDMFARIQGIAIAFRTLGHLLGRNDAGVDQPLCIHHTRGRMLADGLIHQRLSLHGFFGFVVAAPPITDQIDDHILAELHAVVDGNLSDEQHRFWIVAIDVKDRRLNHSRDLGAVFRGPRIILPMGGKADLVVNDDVNGAAGLETPGLGHLKRLHDHALAGEGRITVDEDRNHEVAFVVFAAILAGPNRPFHHGPGNFQVRRVEAQRQVHLPTRRHHVGGEPLVIFDVTGADLIRQPAFELVEQFTRVLAQDVDQHIQTTPVRHADHGFHHAVAAQPLQPLVQHRNQTFRSFQAEPFGPWIAAVQVLLEPFCRG